MFVKYIYSKELLPKNLIIIPMIHKKRLAKENVHDFAQIICGPSFVSYNDNLLKLYLKE